MPLTNEEKQLVRQIVAQRTGELITATTSVQTATAALTDASPDADYTAQEAAYNLIEKKPLEDVSDVFGKI